MLLLRWCLLPRRRWRLSAHGTPCGGASVNLCRSLSPPVLLASRHFSLGLFSPSHPPLSLRPGSVLHLGPTVGFLATGGCRVVLVSAASLHPAYMCVSFVHSSLRLVHGVPRVVQFSSLLRTIVGCVHILALQPFAVHCVDTVCRSLFLSFRNTQMLLSSLLSLYCPCYPSPPPCLFVLFVLRPVGVDRYRAYHWHRSKYVCFALSQLHQAVVPHGK